jgi:pimeloyl-ACP methyl ester carboxylesterase
VPAAVPRPPLDLKKIAFPILAVVGEFDQPYTRTHRLWREAPNFQRVILRNRGHLSSYMAGLAPELYRDALTDFIVMNNPRK